MKKILGAVFAAFTLLLVLVPAQTSQAVPPPGQAAWTPKKCFSLAAIEVCAQFKWETQDDGDGVVVKGIQLDLETYPDNPELPKCDIASGVVSGVLKSPPIKNGSVSAAESGNTDTFADLNDCHAFRSLQLRGKDTGYDVFEARFTVNRYLSSDWSMQYLCEIRPAGPTYPTCFIKKF